MQTKRLFVIAITCLLAVGCAKSTKPDEDAADAVGTDDGEISRQAGIDTGSCRRRHRISGARHAAWRQHADPGDRDLL